MRRNNHQYKVGDKFLVKNPSLSIVQDPWTNSSGEENKEKNTQAQPTSIPPSSTPYAPQHPGPITSKDVGPRGSYGQNKAYPWTNFTSK